MRKTEKKEKPKPKRCVCGSEAITIKKGGKKMISCPNPMKCRANLRTMWRGSEAECIMEWDSLVDSFCFERRNKEGCR